MIHSRQEKIFLMRSRLGRSMGRALVAHAKDVPEIVQDGEFTGFTEVRRHWDVFLVPHS